MRFIFRIMIMGLCLIAPISAFAKVHVFACEPEWGALAKEIGKDFVTIKNATHALQDPHHIRAKPSLIAAIRKSNLVICSGAELEIGWLPLLLDKASHDVQPGQTGYLMAADHVKKLEVKEEVDRSMGDVHPEGNPHIHLNPHNIVSVAKVLTQRLTLIDSKHQEHYQTNLRTFLRKWNLTLERWNKQKQKLKNLPIVVHHTNWAYLIDWLGLKRTATLEPKPGIPPSASHLETLLAQLNHTPARVIIRAPHEDKKPSEWLSKRTKIPAYALPFTIHPESGISTLESLFDAIINQLLEVL